MLFNVAIEQSFELDFHLFIAPIATPFTFFEKQLKVGLAYAILALHSPLRKTPEILYTIDVMSVKVTKLIVAMIHSVMLVIANVNQSVIASPAVTVDLSVLGTICSIIACKVALEQFGTISV